MIVWIIPLLILLYPIELWDPPPPRPAPGAKGAHLPAPPGKGDLALKDYGGLDRQAFLLAFERQAGAELMPCLRAQDGQTGSILFFGRLSRQGRLSGVRATKTQAADCAKLAVEKMDFAEVAKGMRDATLELSWRFDY